MKNIHLLPTPNPSKLAIKTNFLSNEVKLHLRKGEPFTNGVREAKCQHIYITSDEEIKYRDWCYSEKFNDVAKVIANPINVNFSKGYYKVVLTTDQDLINDGVQAISDEFLEWFVKNPSCDNVEVMPIGFEDREDYLIIIPKEVFNLYLERGITITDLSIQKLDNHPDVFSKREQEEFSFHKSITSKIKEKREMFLMNANETVDTRSTVEKMKPFQEEWQKDMDSILDVMEVRKLIIERVAQKKYPVREEGDFIERFGLNYVANQAFIEGAMYSEPQRLEALNRLKYWEDESQRKSDLLVESSKNIAILVKIIEWYDEESDVRPDYRSPYLEEGELTMWEWFEQFKKK